MDSRSSKNIIQINKFSYFHNNYNVFFSKTDFINKTFDEIRDLEHQVILISGNSDYCITDEIVNNIPSNVIKWFCQNRLSNNNLLESIPLGLENTIECKVPNNGYVWNHALIKTELLSKSYNTLPSKFIYANFSLSTNPNRPKIAKICEDTKYITCDIINSHTESNNRSYTQYIDSILNHQAVVCPQGNDQGDNHRVYETLYLGRIPIVFNHLQYKYLHHKFPVILLSSFDQLKDKNYLIDKIEKTKKTFDISNLNYQYWENKIQQEIDKL